MGSWSIAVFKYIFASSKFLKSIKSCAKHALATGKFGRIFSAFLKAFDPSAKFFSAVNKTPKKLKRSEAIKVCARQAENYSQALSAEIYKDCMKDKGFR